jgi:hypothetical protein
MKQLTTAAVPSRPFSAVSLAIGALIAAINVACVLGFIAGRAATAGPPIVVNLVQAPEPTYIQSAGNCTPDGTLCSTSGSGPIVTDHASAVPPCSSQDGCSNFPGQADPSPGPPRLQAKYPGTDEWFDLTTPSQLRNACENGFGLRLMTGSDSSDVPDLCKLVPQK